MVLNFNMVLRTHRNTPVTCDCSVTRKQMSSAAVLEQVILSHGIVQNEVITGFLLFMVEYDFIGCGHAAVFYKQENPLIFFNQVGSYNEFFDININRGYKIIANK